MVQNLHVTPKNILFEEAGGTPLACVEQIRRSF